MLILLSATTAVVPMLSCYTPPLLQTAAVYVGLPGLPQQQQRPVLGSFVWSADASGKSTGVPDFGRGEVT